MLILSLAARNHHHCAIARLIEGSRCETGFKNTVLKSLGSDVIKRLQLRPVSFELEHEIEFPGSPIHNLFFVEEGLASKTFKDGVQVEVGMFGYESVIGASALMGTKRSLNRIYTQIPGSGYSSPVKAARTEFNRGEISGGRRAKGSFGNQMSLCTWNKISQV